VRREIYHSFSSKKLGQKIPAVLGIDKLDGLSDLAVKVWTVSENRAQYKNIKINNNNILSLPSIRSLG